MCDVGDADIASVQLSALMPVAGREDASELPDVQWTTTMVLSSVFCIVPLRLLRFVVMSFDGMELDDVGRWEYGSFLTLGSM